MIATTIYIPRDLYHKVGSIAKAQGKPKAQVIRDFVDDGVSKQQTDPDATRKFVEALKAIQFRGGIKDFAKNHDTYIWG
jgi:predicted DNA-binding protein